MQAVILAGGEGSRLRPITDMLPKPLVPINNVPIIEWQLRYLKEHGVTDAVICSGYKAEMLEHYLGMKGHGVGLAFSRERSPLGTAGAIRNAAPLLRGESFLVLNGDIMTDIDLGRLAARRNAIAGVELRTRFGVLETEGDAVTAFREKKELGGTWMNAGIYHLERSLVGSMPERGDIERTLFPRLASEGRLGIERFAGARWHSIDSFKDLEECAREIRGIA